MQAIEDYAHAPANLAVAFEDAQKAMDIVRARAEEWGIRPDAIGVMGFSAGGHLSSMMAISAPANRKPAFAAPIYPAISNKLPTPESLPPSFLVHATDDPTVGPEHSLRYYELARKMKVPVEMHIYAEGGHGFGIRKTSEAGRDWPLRFEAWLKEMRIID
jgi:acetyl esterase/lipase